MQGFISIHRKLMDNPIWTDPNYLKLWVYCLFKASHKDHEQLVGNQMVPLKRGQFVTGRNALTDDMNRGVKPKQRLDNLTWWRYLNNLQKWGMLNIKKTNKYSLVTIDKYEEYQDVFNKVEHQTEQQLNIKRTSDEQQLNTNNNGNKGNNVKKKYRDRVRLTLKEYERLVDEYGSDRTEQMLDELDSYKGAKGKTYKDDNLAIRRWVVKKVLKDKPLPIQVEVSEQDRIYHRMNILSGDLELGESYFKAKGKLEEFYAAEKEYEELEQKLRAYQN